MELRFSNRTTLGWLLVLALNATLLSACAGKPAALEQQMYERLDEVRERKEQQLSRYIHTAAESAQAIGQDRLMIELYAEKRALYERRREAPGNPELQTALLEVRDQIEDRYIDRYLMFHDLLLIDPDGDIFFTLRKRQDYRQNIFTGELAATALSQSLRQRPQGGFVDFEHYAIAGEPSAYFVVKNHSDSGRGGWFVFQFSINKINEMFSLEHSLGDTGEVFLVNRERAMLTDSRFFAESTALRQHLSRENINAKFSEGQGHKKVVDYRGFKALTSFKVVSIMNSRWLLIAKIDEDEVVTQAYQDDSNKLLLAMEKDILATTPAYTDFDPISLPLLEVDWDEFRRLGDDDKALYTHGVRTCTAIIINYPGEFSYLAHVSANDSLYGGEVTDLLHHIQKRIDNLELVRAKKRQLQIVIISPRPQYNTNIVDALADWGILLSQIRLIFNDQARHANIYHLPGSGDTLIEWKLQGRSAPQKAKASDYPSLREFAEPYLTLADTGAMR